MSRQKLRKPIASAISANANTASATPVISDEDSRLVEFRELVLSAGATIAAEMVQHRPKADPATLIGSGKVEELSAIAASTPAPQTANVTPAPAPASDGTAASTTPDGTSTGTVRLARGLSPSRVLFDGKKLTSATALVSCGTHQIRVNRGRAHSVDVPCGGEIDVSR